MAPTATASDTVLPTEKTTLNYYLEVSDGGIVQTYPGTAFEKRRKHVPHDVTVTDLRSVRDRFTLEKNGFQLVNHHTNGKDFKDEERVRREYYPECAALIKKLTGADHVHVISHMTRRHRFDEAQKDAAAKGDKEFVTKNNPARFVHVDQSYRGAEQILYLNLDEEEADRRLKKRWAIMNVWQPILNTVKRDPLGLCDYQTIDEEDFRTVVANLPPPGQGEYGNVSKNLNSSNKQTTEKDSSSTNEAAAARYEVTNMAHNPDQKWYYASDMTPDEAWVFKIFDSSKKDGRARCVAHSSFPLQDQSDSDGEARQSIEVRCFVFWDDEESE